MEAPYVNANLQVAKASCGYGPGTEGDRNLVNVDSGQYVRTIKDGAVDHRTFHPLNR